jgi:hypothetical protein
VTGDGRADAILVDLGGSTVFLSDGAQFVPASMPWHPELPLGERGNAFTDLTGDGKADVIVHHHQKVLVYQSTGTGFSPPATWMNEPFYGGP